jgi:hypothetical protein
MRLTVVRSNENDADTVKTRTATSELQLKLAIIREHHMKDLWKEIRHLHENKGIEGYFPDTQSLFKCITIMNTR